MSETEGGYLVRLMRRCKIVAYHRVTDRPGMPLAVTTSMFREHLEHFRRRGYTALTLRDFHEKHIARQSLPEGRRLIVTFDDGYRDNLLNAWPVLKAYGWPATLFVVTGYIGKGALFPWDRQGITDPAPEDTCLDWDELAALDAEGMEIASHTVSHPFLSDIEPGQARREMVASRRDLERLGRPVVSFCYPAGRQNADVRAMAEEAGYRVAVVTPPRSGIPVTRFSLPRVGLYARDGGMKFRLKVSRWFDVYRQWRR